MPPCSSTVWRTIASPSPEPGAAACRVGAIEAVEDKAAVGRRDPRPAVAHRQLAVVQPDVDGRARRVPLRGVVEQVGDGAVEPRGHALDQRRLELGGEGDARRVSACPLDRGRDQPVEPYVLDRGRVGRVVAGELDQVADERGQLLELRHQVGAQPRAVAGVRRPAAGEYLEVGPQRGQRRAQLVRGVGDELALRALGALERFEHRVERGREPRDFVLALGLDPAREVARRGDVLGGLGELRDRPDRGAGGEPREHDGERDPHQCERAERPAQRAERAVDLGQRPRGDDRGPVRAAAHVHAHVHVADLTVGVERRLAGPPPRPCSPGRRRAARATARHPARGSARA